LGDQNGGAHNGAHTKHKGERVRAPKPAIVISAADLMQRIEQLLSERIQEKKSLQRVK
jgi:hypothetical protein